jgi:hypothetical protein
MSEFEVGDLVKVVKCEHGQPKEMLGKVCLIRHIWSDLIAKITIPGEDFAWSFIFSELEHAVIEGEKYAKPSGAYQGKFFLKDGTPGVVNVTVYGNVTQVVIIVDPKPVYQACDKPKQFFGGLAYCNPKDKFDLNTGIRVACKNAMTNGYQLWCTFEYRRSIYSAIRKAMRGEK